jgi:hypothetical protein
MSPTSKHSRLKSIYGLHLLSMARPLQRPRTLRSNQLLCPFSRRKEFPYLPTMPHPHRLDIDSSLMREDVDLGQDVLRPDWPILKMCHYAPGHTQVMCFIHISRIRDGKDFCRYPRSRLQEFTSRVKDKNKSGLSLRNRNRTLHHIREHRHPTPNRNS